VPTLSEAGLPGERSHGAGVVDNEQGRNHGTGEKGLFAG
jgi:hypothetical protein